MTTELSSIKECCFVVENYIAKTNKPPHVEFNTPIPFRNISHVLEKKSRGFIVEVTEDEFNNLTLNVFEKNLQGVERTTSVHFDKEFTNGLYERLETTLCPVVFTDSARDELTIIDGGFTKLTYQRIDE